VRKLLAFVFLIVIASAGCTRASVANQPDNSNAAAQNTQPETTGQGLAASSVTTTTPDALVAALYKQHDAKKSPFFQSKDRALVDKYFTKATADLIWKDATRKNQDEVGALDGDPLYNAQDTEIKNFKVGAAVIKNDKATVTVTFDNFGKKQTIQFLLAQEKNAWKISDIDYGQSQTLAKWLSDEYSSKVDAPADPRFEGTYQVGETTCTVKPIKMAFEVKWVKGTGSEIFIYDDRRVTGWFTNRKKQKKAKRRICSHLTTIRSTQEPSIAPTAKSFPSSG
jgi:hypothetical protein